MGLFDKLKKDLFNTAKKAITDLVEDKLEESISQKHTSASPAAPAKPVPAGAPAADAYAFQGTTEEYFAQILQSRFPQYEIRRNVRFSTPLQDAVPVNFLIRSNGQSVLAVIVCDKHLHGRRRLRDTIQACDGIPVQCYYTQFRNDANYVIQRLGQVLR